MVPKSGRSRSALRRQLNETVYACGRGWDLLRHEGPGQVQFWFIALMIGIAAGFTAVLFRTAIESLQALFYGTPDVNTLASFIEVLPWYMVLLIPMAGGLRLGYCCITARPMGGFDLSRT